MKGIEPRRVLRGGSLIRGKQLDGAGVGRRKGQGNFHAETETAGERRSGYALKDWKKEGTKEGPKQEKYGVQEEDITHVLGGGRGEAGQSGGYQW